MENESNNKAGIGVNPQVTDAVTQTNVKVLAEVPAYSMGLVYQATSHSLSLMTTTAGETQSAMQKVTQAIAAKTVSKIMGS